MAHAPIEACNITHLIWRMCHLRLHSSVENKTFLLRSHEEGGQESFFQQIIVMCFGANVFDGLVFYRIVPFIEKCPRMRSMEGHAS